MLRKAITVLLIALLLATAFFGGYAISKRADEDIPALFCLDTGG